MRIQKSLQVQAYDYIKDLILTGKMQYDQIYSETKIAKEIGLSRTPMRDAIQCLSQEKYIDIIPNKGFCLHKMETQDFIETYQIRTAIEGYCGRKLAGEHETQEAQKIFKILERCLLMQNLANENQSIEDFFEADTEFHHTLIHSIKNEELISLYESYIYRMRNFAMHSLSHKGRMQEAYQEHYRIYESMKEGKINQVYDDIVYHMESPRLISVASVETYYNQLKEEDVL